MNAPPQAAGDAGGRVAAAVERCRLALLPNQRSAFDRMAQRLELTGDSGASYFLAARALPVTQLPTWCCALAGRRGRGLAVDAPDQLCESAVAGYLHVRLQDDLLDEGVGRPVEVMLLAEALLVRHLYLLGEVAGEGAGLRQLVADRWRHYGDAMLLESQVHAGTLPCDTATFLRLLDRSRPLVLPGAAALAAAGLGAEMGPLDDYVGHLVDGHQRFHDLQDAERDLREGRQTLVTRRYGDGGGAAMRRRLVLEGGFDGTVAEARTALEAAASSAAALGLDEAVADAEGRIEAMAASQRAVFERLFRALLEK
jgi:hypothetical protein